VTLNLKVFNYGAGNLYSIQAALKREGVTPSVTKTGAGIEEADAIILPGVGSFDQAAKTLPMERAREVIDSGKPVLGICLGLQLFYSSSEEGSAKGLSLLPGRVRRFPPTVKVPQIGWNTLSLRREGDFTDGVPDGSWVYYVNSFVPDAKGGSVAATTSYGVEYPALVAQKNIYGTQFHPEKSGTVGRRVLQNFIRAVRR
jgi:glutamine amidotransferase